MYIYIYSKVYIVNIVNIVMKISKLFTIDADLCEKLKNINGSALVSQLLEQHFSIFDNKSSLLEQKKGVLDEIKKKKRLFPLKLRSLMSLKRWVSTVIRKDGLKPDLANPQSSRFPPIPEVEASQNHVVSLLEGGKS